MKVVIRLFLAGADQASGRSLGLKLAADLKAKPSEYELTVRPYWKIPEYLEVLVAVELHGSVVPGLQAAKARLANDWNEMSPSEWMWSAGGGVPAQVGGLRWAHVELVEPFE